MCSSYFRISFKNSYWLSPENNYADAEVTLKMQLSFCFIDIITSGKKQRKEGKYFLNFWAWTCPKKGAEKNRGSSWEGKKEFAFPDSDRQNCQEMGPVE